MCSYCKGPFTKDLIDESNILLSVDYAEGSNEPALVLCVLSGMYGKKINYCPMCGKNLRSQGESEKG